METISRTEQFTGTEPMRQGLELDVAAVQRYFEENVGNFSGQAQVKQFKGGQSNPSYKVEADGKAWVIRRKPPGKLQPSAHAVDREYRVITALGPTDVPVPKTYALCTDTEVLGTPFYVMECVEGRVFWESLLPGMSKQQRFEIYDAMNDTMAKLHSVDYQAVGLEGFGKPGNYVARQTHRWGRQYQEAVYERIPEMDKLIAWIEERLPELDETSVVHGDYRLDNMIFHPTEPRVLAILDWELATLGDPLADFAYHTMQWRIPQNLHRGLLGIDIEELGIPDEEIYIEAYCRRTGRDGIANFDVYSIFNMFKLAAIAHGILVREKIGTASSVHASKTAAVARPLAELAWQNVVERGLA